jgi:hypothetical protein
MRSLIVLATAVALGFLLTVVPGSQVFADVQVVVQVAPATILIGADQAEQVTVHAAIPYITVDAGTVKLNGLPPESTWADDRGELVARFLSADVEALPEVAKLGDIELTLSGVTKDGVDFSGTDTVRVVEFSGADAPKGK